MKRACTCIFLALIMVTSMVYFPARAVASMIHCQPGDTFYAVFALAEDGDQPDNVMCRLVYDTDIFTLVPGMDLVGADGFSIRNKYPAVLMFKVNKYAPAGEYSIQAAVIEAADADGRKYTNAKIDPVRVTVESAAAAGNVKKPVAAGDYVSFGHYPQTAAGNDQTPIEWLVLEVQGNKALLLSRYGLESKPFNEKFVDITWEKCTLRSWLNHEFMNEAFSSTEQKAILTTAVDNSSSQGYSKWNTRGGNNTQDKIFLLSCGEAYKYLGVTWEDSNNIKSRTSPTAYAVQAGAQTSDSNKTAGGKAAGWWWLRSPGYYQSGAASVLDSGSLLGGYVINNGGCVRPALWVNLDSGIF